MEIKLSKNQNLLKAMKYSQEKFEKKTLCLGEYFLCHRRMTLLIKKL